MILSVVLQVQTSGRRLQTPLIQPKLFQKQEDFYSVMTGLFRFRIWRTPDSCYSDLLKRKATEIRVEPESYFPANWIGLFEGLLAVIGLCQGRRITAWLAEIKGEHLWVILTLFQWLNQYIRNYVNICGLWSYVWRLFTRIQEDEQFRMCVGVTVPFPNAKRLQKMSLEMRGLRNAFRVFHIIVSSAKWTERKGLKITNDFMTWHQ